MIQSLRDLAYEKIPGALKLWQLKKGQKYKMLTKYGYMNKLGRLTILDFHQGSYNTGDPYWDIRFDIPIVPSYGLEFYEDYAKNISYDSQNTHIFLDTCENENEYGNIIDKIK